MDVRLVVKKGPAKARAFRLRNADTIVGRETNCDLRIPSATVSRRHCLLRFRDDYLTVEDLQSANGTYLNGARINGREMVRPGDQLEIGPLTFVVEYQLTREAIDRMLRGDAGEEDFGDFVEALPLPSDEPETEDLGLTPLAEEPARVPVFNPPPAGDDQVMEVNVFFDETQPWKPPEDGEMRDILSQLDDK
jgi:pSer/pThr/pTyr-binding forkhead associated (FHA) protein